MDLPDRPADTGRVERVRQDLGEAGEVDHRWPAVPLVGRRIAHHRLDGVAQIGGFVG